MQKSTYTPVHPDFYDVLEDQKQKNPHFNVHFFDDQGTWDNVKGEFKGLNRDSNGEFLVLTDNSSIRLDKIIALNGKPGPAHDEFDSYANACLDCKGGNNL